MKRMKTKTKAMKLKNIALQEQYEPKITISYINGGFFT